YETSRRLYAQGKGVESEENMRGAKLTWERYIYGAMSKTQAISVAAAELKQAQTTLEMHALRSTIPGRNCGGRPRRSGGPMNCASSFSPAWRRVGRSHRTAPSW